MPAPNPPSNRFSWCLSPVCLNEQGSPEPAPPCLPAFLSSPLVAGPRGCECWHLSEQVLHRHIALGLGQWALFLLDGAGGTDGWRRGRVSSVWVWEGEAVPPPASCGTSSHTRDDHALTSHPVVWHRFIGELAVKYNAMIVGIEHRFYGESVPNGDQTTPHLKYLTVKCVRTGWLVAARCCCSQQARPPKVQASSVLIRGGDTPTPQASTRRFCCSD